MPANANPSEEYASQSDHELVEAYRVHAAEGALTTLLARYRPQLFGRCLHLLKNWHAAEDCYHTVVEEIIQLLNSDKHIKHFPAICYQIASHRAIDVLRRDQRRQSAYAALAEETEKNQSTFVENPDLVRLSMEQSDKEAFLREQLRQLPELQRRCLEQFYFERLSYRQIAEALELPLGRVKSALQNGKRRLRLLLENDGPME